MNRGLANKTKAVYFSVVSLAVLCCTIMYDGLVYLK